MYLVGKPYYKKKRFAVLQIRKFSINGIAFQGDKSGGAYPNFWDQGKFRSFKTDNGQWENNMCWIFMPIERIIEINALALFELGKEYFGDQRKKYTPFTTQIYGG